MQSDTAWLGGDATDATPGVALLGGDATDGSALLGGDATDGSAVFAGKTGRALGSGTSDTEPLARFEAAGRFGPAAGRFRDACDCGAAGRTGAAGRGRGTRYLGRGSGGFGVAVGGCVGGCQGGGGDS